ncbi:uncharacterized protein RCC_03127 [Ramularia collo-cygni]|uniref:Uncharacterized protein n=1 Tax=Ramularia collo-cygni TaxID=112498 RepID=A0A2D3VA36_9PEZI|nr:uncharacterized protein RCC_03127 [Ramularia collo-cygni]CZT17293.1 uncharacterized protein RCC_03127 [Ramularia collo-cygni]
MMTTPLSHFHDCDSSASAAVKPFRHYGNPTHHVAATGKAGRSSWKALPRDIRLQEMSHPASQSHPSEDLQIDTTNAILDCFSPVSVKSTKFGDRSFQHIAPGCPRPQHRRDIPSDDPDGIFDVLFPSDQFKFCRILATGICSQRLWDRDLWWPYETH